VDADYAGGAERYILLIARGLDRRRFEPVVLIKEGADLDEWRRETERAGIEVHQGGMGLPFQPWDAVGIFRALWRIRPDIVHVNVPGPYDGQMGLLAPLARLAGARAVLTSEHLPMVERLWKRALLKNLTAGWVDRVLTVCRANVPYLVERQNVRPEKIEVIYNALPEQYGVRRDIDRRESRARFGLAPETTAFLMVGSLIERKGLPVLLEALGPLLDLNWKLLVAGEGEDRARFEQLADSLGLRERIDFLGFQSDSSIEKLLSAGDVLVLPSFMEAMPYVILEAMACRLPVVASNIYGIPEVVVDGKTACLVEPGQVEPLRRRLKEMISFPSAREAVGRRGRERFEAVFTIEKQIESIQAIYYELLSISTPNESNQLGSRKTS
jgi:glycosyltransferase involved in cell wall biosynthesis